MQAWRPALQRIAFARVFDGTYPEVPWQVVISRVEIVPHCASLTTSLF